MTRTEPSRAEVVDRLAHVRDRIRTAAGTDDNVTVVAVTKGHGPAAAVAAVEAGLTDVGENYAAELVATAAALGTGGSRPPRRSDEKPPHGNLPELPVRVHFLGRVQRNKVRTMADVVHLWQGVDRLAAGREIARRSPGAAVLVQLDVSGEAAKNGCRPGEAVGLVDELVGIGLDVRGLMAVGPTGSPEDARPGFRTLVALAERLGLPERSIGMTDDLEVAVSEGATMIRVGRGLFGPRNGADDLRR
ncbi:MAG: YggS family pyridoxal phosphate-dependent enzyme [Acidimicrobiales bacterium]